MRVGGDINTCPRPRLRAETEYPPAHYALRPLSFRTLCPLRVRRELDHARRGVVRLCWSQDRRTWRDDNQAWGHLLLGTISSIHSLIHLSLSRILKYFGVYR